MSHISKLRTKLKFVNKNIAKQAIPVLNKLLAELGYHNVISEYLDSTSARDIYVTVHGDFVIRVNTGREVRYIGVKNTEQGVEFEFDDWGWRNIRETITDNFTKAYILTALNAVAEENGYKIKNASLFDNGAIYAEFAR